MLTYTREVSVLQMRPTNAAFASRTSPTSLGVRLAWACALLVADGACHREPEPYVCPDVGPGDLVITELRGPQASPNSLPQWIEIANVSGNDLDLAGLHLQLSRRDGSGPLDLIVRFKRDLIDADYYVLGFVPDDMREGGVDYGLAGDHDGDLYVDGLLALTACGEVIDEIQYENLPDAGTRSLGVSPPDAEANDDDDVWCTDATPQDGPMTELGLPGTPGEANRPCS